MSAASGFAGKVAKPVRRVERITKLDEGKFRPTSGEGRGPQRSQFVAGPLQDRPFLPRKVRPIYHRETGGVPPSFGYDTTGDHLDETIFWGYFFLVIVIIVISMVFALPEGNMNVYNNLNKSSWVIPAWALPVAWFFFYIILGHAALRSAMMSGVKEIDIIPGIELRGFTIVAFLLILLFQVLWTYATFDTVTLWPAFYFALLMLIISVFWLAVLWTDDRQTSISLLLFSGWAAYLTAISYDLATKNPVGTDLEEEEDES
uniref:TspO/MBR family protein n=1 Tax=Pithovirus LCPAC103 TaxID=2506588 RepID=A0A481Z3Y4_9VIRU|nr:MAG: TspO/MBR family protein [Pithovirus LCPAC103]